MEAKGEGSAYCVFHALRSRSKAAKADDRVPDDGGAEADDTKVMKDRCGGVAVF
jgi:hypothetical protein